MDEMPFSLSLSMELAKHVSDYTRELKVITLGRRRELGLRSSAIIELFIVLVMMIFFIPCLVYSTAKFLTLYILRGAGMVLCYILGFIPLVGMIISLAYSVVFAVIEMVLNIVGIILYIIPLSVSTI